MRVLVRLVLAATAWLVLTSVCSASATNIYIAQRAAGAANGADCADAYAYTFFNTTGDWGTGAAQIGPGTTVHLCGTFSLSAGASLLTAQGSGTSGSPVTILFEAGVVIKAPYLSSTGAIVLDGQSYITVDGGSNGSIENTLNGSPGATCLGGTCSYQQASVAISAHPCSNCEIKNLTIQDLYIHTQCDAPSGCDTTIGDSAVNAVYFGGSNLLIHNNTMHDASWVLSQNSSSGDTNDQIYDNDIYNMDDGVACGSATGTISSEFIYNNHFHDMANWDTGTADAYHHDGIHCFSAGGTAKIQNLYIYNNLFDGNEGNCCVTAWIFLEGTSSGSTPWTDSTGTAYLWNNVVIGSIDVPNSNVWINMGTGHEFFNNTIIVASPHGGGCLGFGSGATNIVVENNAVEGCNAVINGSGATSYTTIDYDNYANANGGSPIWQFAAVSANTLSAWQTSCGCDLHSLANLSGTLALSSEGVPQSGYTGIGAGANLTSYCSGNLASLCSDTSVGDSRTPAARPSSGAWDIGAYQFGYHPLPPSAVSAILH